MSKAPRIENGRCTCTAADTCPLGKTGMAANCSKAELAVVERNPRPDPADVIRGMGDRLETERQVWIKHRHGPNQNDSFDCGVIVGLNIAKRILSEAADASTV